MKTQENLVETSDSTAPQALEETQPPADLAPDDSVVMVNPHLRVTRVSDDEVLVKHGTRSTFSEVLLDEGRTKLLGRVLERLRTPATLADLRAEGLVSEELAPVVADLIAHLRSQSVLIDPGDDLALAYVDTVLERGGEGSARIASQHVAIVGAGPLGARIARSVAAMRPRALELVDESASAGRPDGGGSNSEGAAALAAAIAAGGFASVRAREGGADDESTMRELLDASDLVILALNAYSPSALHRLNELAIAHETPWLAVYFDGSDAVIGPLHVPGESPCHLEVEIQTEASVGIRDDYLVYKESLDADPRLDSFVLPAHLDTAAGLAASAALRFLVSGGCFCVGRSVRVDFERMAVDTQEFLRLPRCPACVGLRPAYQHEFL